MSGAATAVQLSVGGSPHVLACTGSPSSSEAVVRVLWVTVCLRKTKQEAEGVLGRHPRPVTRWGLLH